MKNNTKEIQAHRRKHDCPSGRSFFTFQNDGYVENYCPESLVQMTSDNDHQKTQKTLSTQKTFGWAAIKPNCRKFKEKLSVRETLKLCTSKISSFYLRNSGDIEN